LTGFAQSTVAHTHAETFEQAFERGRPAIHGRSLHYFGSEYPTMRVIGGQEDLQTKARTVVGVTFQLAAYS
jgi:hypothetical protein